MKSTAHVSVEVIELEFGWATLNQISEIILSLIKRIEADSVAFSSVFPSLSETILSLGFVYFVLLKGKIVHN